MTPSGRLNPWASLKALALYVWGFVIALGQLLWMAALGYQAVRHMALLVGWR